MNTKPVLFSACLCMAAFTIHAQTTKHMEKRTFSNEQKEVMKVILDMTEAFHNQDMEGIMASYEPNAVIVFEPEKPISGKDAIEQGFMDFFAVNPKFQYPDHEVFINGDLAMHFAPWTMTGKAPDGTEIMQSGLSVAVLRKQSNGKWLMVFDNPFGQYLMQQQ
jgi:uncharacterized protein (TIGR02246 family)